MSQAVFPESKSKAKQLFVADSLSKSVVLIGCLMVLQRGIAFLRSTYVCGVLSPAEVGQWDLAFSFLMLAAPLAVLGIPGSFGRYVTHFEKRGQQGRFLRQTFAVCLGLVLLATGTICLFRSSIAQWFLGSRQQSDVVLLLAAGLPTVAFFNFASCWFMGRRLNRIVFRIQFSQTLCFAVFCVIALQAFDVSATAVIVAYLGSCLLGLLLAIGYLFLSRSGEQRDGLEGAEKSDDETASIWEKVLPFAIWVWLSNALINLFSVCDRLLLVNFHSGSGVDVQSLVGQYHTSRIFPLILLAVGATIASMATPYLSKEWESGHRESVVRRLNVMIKTIGLTCLSLAVGVLLFAPVLFEGIWRDKFAMGESLLPITLSYCSLAAMTLVAQKFFWCIEKTWFSSTVLAVGLIVNFSLGLALIGPWGISGVVAATFLSHAVVLAGVLALCRRSGMRIDPGVWIVVVAVLAMSLGKLATCVAVAGMLGVIVCTEAIFSDAEKRSAIQKINSWRAKLPGAFQ